MASSMPDPKKFPQVAASWGPALTKAVVGGDISDFKSLFVESEPVTVVLQTAEGEEAVCSVGSDPEECLMTWEDFVELSSKDLAEQDYTKTEAQCLGVLGDRMIMETGRFNSKGEVYLEAYALVTLNGDGKIIMMEAFTDVQAPTLLSRTDI